MAISMLKIRRRLGRLIFNMGIAIPGKTVFLIETAPWDLSGTYFKNNIPMHSEVSRSHDSNGDHPRNSADENAHKFSNIPN